MSQEKAQLIAPIGIMTVSGMTATGVITASSFTGNVVGAAKSLVNGTDVTAGVVTGTSFVGNLTGNIQRLADSAPNINVGVTTATSFVGNLTGSVTDLTSQPAITVGLVTASSLSGPITGNIVGDVTGNVTGNIVGDVTGNVTGNATGTSGGLGVNYNGGWTGAGTSQVRAGVVTATSFYGDGSNLEGVSSGPVSQQAIGTTYSIDVTSPAGGNYTLSGTDRNGTVSGSDPTVTVEVGDTLNFVVDASGHPFYIRVSDGGANVSTPAATNQGATDGTVSWTPNTAGTYYYQCGNHAGMLGTITVNATTTVDLSLGNVIYYTQTNDTTVSFANTANGNVYFIRTKDDNTTARTITWPATIDWDGGNAPTLIQDNPRTTDAQVFLLITRDMGLTWYGKEVVRHDPQSFSLFSWGWTQYGQLGHNQSVAGGGVEELSSPTQIGTNTNWKTLGTSGWSVGENEVTYGIKTNGTLWAWGRNNHGMLGLGNLTERSSPMQIGTDTTWRNVAVGQIVGLATKTDGTLWSWGYNGNGSLGLNQAGPANRRSSPTQIAGTTWSRAHGGYAGNTAVKTDGTLWAWGNNGTGMCGQNSGTPRFSSPVQIPGTWDDGEYKVDASEGAIGGIKANGTLWTWGGNESGISGRNDDSSNAFRSSPVQVGSDATWDILNMGKNHAGAIKTDGTLWVWGLANETGCLGLNEGGVVRYSSPVQVPGTTWSNVFAGGTRTLATKTDNTLWAWGWNNKGGLGLNQAPAQLESLSSPTQIPGTSWEKVQLTAYGATVTQIAG
jgi:alpha-tubulin suppressor-like RCC1 family protein/plastocyanin